MTSKSNRSCNHLLEFRQPADFWEECILLGNGQMGLTMWGGIGRERIQLNHESFWAGSPEIAAVKPAPGRITEVRRLISEEQYLEAEAILETEFTGEFTSPYQSMGELSFEYEVPALESKVRNYQRSLDLSQATYSQSYECGRGSFGTQAFTSFPSSLAIIKFSSGEDCRYSGSLSYLSPYISFGQETQVYEGVDNIEYRIKAPSRYDGFMDSRDPEFSETAGIEGSISVRVHIADGRLRIENGIFYIEEASELEICIRIETDWGKSEIPVMDFLKATDRSFGVIMKEHLKDYTNLYQRIDLCLGPAVKDGVNYQPERLQASHEIRDPGLIELFFNYGRYLLISSSRPGGQPANLQGIWNSRINPPWWSNYTININTEMNYWGACLSGLEENSLPLFEFALRLMESGARTAKNLYDCSGWCTHHQTDIWVSTDPRGRNRDGAIDKNAQYSIWPFGGVWFSLMAWNHFEYTGETAFLSKYAKPLLEGSIRFLRDFLVEDGARLTTSPSSSPENRYLLNEEMLAVSQGSTMDLSLTLEALQSYIKMSGKISCDEELVLWCETSLDKIRPFRKGKLGQLQEWYKDWDRLEDKHRHQSHLLSVFPGDALMKPGMEEYLNAAERSLEMRGPDATGWSLVWKIALQARLGRPDQVAILLDRFLHLVQPGDEQVHMTGGGSYPNLLCAHPPFQIDGNLGIVAAISEILVRQIDSTITFLPALPEDWQEGWYRGVRCRRGISFDIDWRESRLISVKMRATKSGSWTLIYGKVKTVVKVQAGDELLFDGDLKQLG